MISQHLADILGTVSRPAEFCVAGKEQMLAPGLAVDGIGPIALPLLPIQAEALIATAERAPHGRGQDTITDIAVRRTWQISPERVRIAGKHWPKTLQTIVTRVAESLGITDPIKADLYKLLIYDQGSFFVPHRDTEKADGMFATLVLALPSLSEGGALIVRHQDREMRVDLHCEDASDIAFAAFYADCVHEVLPITAGYRLVLVYNLLRRGPGQLPEIPDYDTQQDALASLLMRWAEALRDPETTEPEKLIYQLEHAYTPAELGFGSLKGADGALAPVIVAAAQRAGCDVHLALVSIEEDGIAEQTDGFSRYSDGEFEVVEMNERTAIASAWRRPDGKPSPLTEIPVEEEEFAPPLSFDDLEPDEEHFHEATGNEGASYERTYSRTALILWPSDRILAVINQGGLAVTLPFLEDLTNRWTASGDASIRDQARELSGYMRSDWGMAEWYPRLENERSGVGQFLSQLVRLEDTAQIDAFLTPLVTRGGFDIGDAADIAAALHSLPPDRCADLATSLLACAAEPALSACGDLLARLAALDPASATSAARTLVAALPGDPARQRAAQIWRRGPGVRPTFIADLFTALGRIDATLAAVAADHVLTWPDTYDFDTVLLPAVRTLLDAPEVAGQAAVQRLTMACLTHLDNRIALPLEAPRDWRRDNVLGCECADCRALSLYLGDATREIWVFAAAQHRRGHVESTIRTAHCDVRMATEKRGSPHRLVCTKTKASYERRCKQRANDLAAQTRLEAQRLKLS